MYRDQTVCIHSGRAGKQSWGGSIQAVHGDGPLQAWTACWPCSFCWASLVGFLKGQPSLYEQSTDRNELWLHWKVIWLTAYIWATNLVGLPPPWWLKLATRQEEVKKILQPLSYVDDILCIKNVANSALYLQHRYFCLKHGYGNPDLSHWSLIMRMKKDFYAWAISYNRYILK